MKFITFLIKPASSLCNMRCKYCFYEDVSENRAVKSMGIMTEDTARHIVQKAFDTIEDGGSISFMFQGGEPTVAGLPFFRNFMKLEQQHRKPSVSVSHAIQTNGMTLDEEWTVFFQENDFLVGLSVDGSQEIHDRFRVDAGGRGSWQKVTESLQLLEKHHVETNLLCVVTKQMAKKAQRVWSSLTKLGNHPLQFIPCLDPLEEKRGSFPYSLTPEHYGTFLCNLFDCWYEAWKQGRYVSVRLFDDYIRILVGMAPSCCAASGACGHYMVAEADGSLYPCDFFVLDRWYMGNINSLSIPEALSSEASKAFGDEGRNRPEACRKCPYFMLCRGGCKRDWTEQHTNYYCPSFQAFFAYALPRLQEMARHL